MRVIAKSHRDLEQLVREGGFREDSTTGSRCSLVTTRSARQARRHPLLAEHLLARARRRRVPCPCSRTSPLRRCLLRLAGASSRTRCVASSSSLREWCSSSTSRPRCAKVAVSRARSPEARWPCSPATSGRRSRTSSVARSRPPWRSTEATRAARPRLSRSAASLSSASSKYGLAKKWAAARRDRRRDRRSGGR